MKEELLKALKEAMKEKDDIKKNTITCLRAAILQVEKDKQITLSESQMQEIVAKEVKKRKESIPEYQNGGRDDIVNNLKQEIEILEKYLPKQLTKEEIIELVKESIKNTKATTPRDMGIVMKDIKEKVAGKADGKVVSDIVKELLANN